MCAGRHGVRHRCVIPQPLPIPLPYPQRFPPGTSRHGDLPDALQPPQQLLNQPWGNQQVVPAAADTKSVCSCMRIWLLQGLLQVAGASLPEACHVQKCLGHQSILRAVFLT